MSKIGNYRVEIQETDDYRFGYESADRGEPAPAWFVETGDSEGLGKLAAQHLGWQDWHTENGQFGVGA